ncbi:MAG: hypothetical protein E6G94_10270 [Alphaproteobacteria bacterium]|nr:MAG: hypothetical protein E6G94_10270 [Alphaproteobacteria bacterium]
MLLLARAFPGLFVMAVAVVLILSARPILPTTMPRVDAIDTVPNTINFASVRRYTDFGSGLLPYTEREKVERGMRRRDQLEEPEVKLGWSYSETTFLGMPYWASQDFGLVTFMETGAGYQIAILMPEQVKLLSELSGKDYGKRSFPLLMHLWGWLFPLGLGLCLWFSFYIEAKKREALGVV